MNAEAITMMIVAMVALWGGLALAIFNLTRHDGADAEDFHRDL
ncbi:MULTISPECIES: methionine/alanine import family NSS transporter small subunit [Aeromicrobium]|uniref:Methionine/alanine import family NSS transporter small subunit n=1 Tax=Aeromicrobium phoceense TaxID=2754045 RepID=A0A838XH33_9ACTN|nr:MULTISPECIES: methionine/alanine import family NSS transporter small subunit [Aeromicrobium]MBA4609895.1 methionine/alanine import family NSS transporter small subunit [Aeromicrobium phoceense]